MNAPKFKVGDLVEARSVICEAKHNNFWIGFDLSVGTVGIVEKIEENTKDTKNIPGWSFLYHVAWEWGRSITPHSVVYEYQIRPA